MDESNCYGWLGLASGRIDDGSVDCGEQRCASEHERNKPPHTIAFPHLPQNFMGSVNLAPQLPQTVPGFGNGGAGAAGFPVVTFSISAITPASSFCKPSLVS